VGVAVGEVSAASFFAAFFFLGDSLGEADSSAAAVAPFFLVVDFLVVAAVEVPVEVVAAVSCFCAQETTNAVAITATIKLRNDFFIGVWLRFYLADQNCKLLLGLQARKWANG
jgi:hypothetical protein